MTGDENKRFCSKCQLHVIDFTQIPALEIVDYLKSHTSQRVCGRINTQVQSIWMPEIQIELSGKPASNNKLLYRFSLAAMLLSSCSPCTQDKVEVETNSEIRPSDSVSQLDLIDTQRVETPQTIETEKKCVDPDNPKSISKKIPPLEIGIVGEIEIIEKDPQILYKMLQFPGGVDSLKAFIQKNLNYPDREIQGRVIIKFSNDTLGRIVDPEVVKSIPNGEKLDSAAIELVRSMPLWIPGENIFGAKIPGTIHLPIRFKLRE